ncbi:methionine synthase [Methanobacterium sp. ACI-7]|uniref:methionine synthase n=1 Tax=unclassified Methanobacterium TaxID=2627676 RepID=UPI0039C21DFF
MLTTVVGSYPVVPHKPATIKDKILNAFGAYDEYKLAVEVAVYDQIEAGIDIISDGQVRDGMVEIFAKAIPGMTVEDNTPKIIGKITPSHNPICISDFGYALKVAECISKEYKENPQKSIKEGIKGVKGILTGPSTLVFSSRMEGFYNKKEDAIIDLAYALKKEAKYLEDAGALLIQIDEPFISTGVVDINIAKKAVKIIVEDLSIPAALHVCGDVTAVFQELLKFPVDIIDCEFAGIPQNVELLKNVDLNGKKLGLGCLDTKTDKVETKEEVENLIKEVANLVGAENILADPDCGMRMRSRDAAFSKLKVMAGVAKSL